jgi:hypothetical protein
MAESSAMGAVRGGKVLYTTKAGKQVYATQRQIDAWNSAGKSNSAAAMNWRDLLDEAIGKQEQFKRARPNEYRVSGGAKSYGKYVRRPTEAQKEIANQRAKNKRAELRAIGSNAAAAAAIREAGPNFY